MTDTIRVTFPDDTSFSIEVGAGGADATVEAIINRKGEFATGWVRDAAAPGRLYNLGAAINLQIEPDPGTPAG